MGKVKPTTANRPSIILELELHLADYCRFIFETSEDGAIILKRNHDFGKHIPSFVRISEVPVKRPLLVQPVTFILPITKNNHYALNHNFYYVTRWGEERIQDYIETEFKRIVRNMFEEGYSMNFTQKEIIESIVKGFNIQNNALSFEAIKKIDYRRRERIKVKRFLELQSTEL